MSIQIVKHNVKAILEAKLEDKHIKPYLKKLLSSIQEAINKEQEMLEKV